MPSPKIIGFIATLKGVKGRPTKNVKIKLSDVSPGDYIAIESDDERYKWTGLIGNNPNKVDVECVRGDMTLRRRGRYRGLALGAGDIIDVTVTVTNSDGTALLDAAVEII